VQRPTADTISMPAQNGRHTHTEREEETHTHIYQLGAAMFYCNCKLWRTLRNIQLMSQRCHFKLVLTQWLISYSN